MSRGPGRIERAIVAAFEAEPDNAFTVEDLCDRVYRGVNRVEKKHRVSMIRAMKTLVERERHLSLRAADTRGGTLVIFSKISVLSYAMARLKAEHRSHYRFKEIPLYSVTEDRLREDLSNDRRYRSLVAEGGAWWQHCQEWIAEHKGDHALAAEWKAKNEAEDAEFVTQMKAVAQALSNRSRRFQPAKRRSNKAAG